MVWVHVPVGVGVAVGVAGIAGAATFEIVASCDVLAATLRFVVPRLRDCASANGIALTATSESRINALRRICALIEGLICFFIVLALVIFEVEAGLFELR
jgi:hypothetical protein